MTTFKLTRRKDRPATIEERRALINALLHARQKLVLYRALQGGEYIGGVEFTILIKEIDAALGEDSQ